MPDNNILWNRFRQGDENAFAELIDVYLEVLFRYGVKFVRDEEMVKDCIQDLFIKLYNNRKNISETSDPKAYLLFSLKNMIRDALRKQQKIILYSNDKMEFIGEYELPREIDKHDNEEIILSLQKVLKMLTPKQREIIYLRYKLGLSYQEIATILGINYQSTRNLAFRTIEKIRSEIDPLMIGIIIKLYLFNFC